MPRTEFDPVAQLKLLGTRDFKIPFKALAAVPDDAGAIRKSAVLLLFGESSNHLPQTPTDLDILLIQRSPNLRYHAGQISFPGGGVEPQDQNHTDTALRENHEETGVPGSQVTPLGELQPLFLPVSNNLVTPVLGWRHTRSEIRADQVEAISAFRASLAELLNPENRGTLTLKFDGHKVGTPAFEISSPHGKTLLWGFTAMVFDGVISELGWEIPWDESRQLYLPTR
ncbi:NUDIX hydrolase [Canibacter zhoujuaniae]|uniref:NUDIX hydrolase n=1 Tax=Canibacter zhoujuaniae TaxID=2708343 RepID=UPI001423CF4A|nr:CoA pyrophosphatase [Canibacter zhoujuaniae]